LELTTQSRLHESNGRRLRRRGFDSLNSVRLGAKNAHTACVFAKPGIQESQQERIMKYLLLIAAITALTGATTISSSDTGCCGGGACCPGGCCMTMTR